MPATIHAILRWNPTSRFNRFAPRGILLWTDVFKKFPVGSPESYAWWGKISQGEYVGMQPPAAWQTRLNQQIEAQENLNNDRGKRKEHVETHLYMYCDADTVTGTRQSLHVGKVVEVKASQNSVPLDDPHVPTEFYVSKRDESEANRRKFKNEKLIPYWFKLADIRQIDPSYKDNLRLCDVDGNPDRPYDPVEVIPYPCGVIEVEPQTFFAPSDLEARQWNASWEETEAIIRSMELQPGGKTDKHGQVLVLHRAKEMAQCIAPLLRHGREIIFADRYFDPYAARFVNALGAFLVHVAVRNQSRIRSVEYHLMYQPDVKRQSLPFDSFKQGCIDEVTRVIPEGLKITFLRWKALPDGQDFHDRFILSDLAGVDFGRGLDEGKLGTRNKVKVTLLEPPVRTELWNRYQRKATVYDLVDEVCMSRKGLIGSNQHYPVPANR